MIYGSPLKRVTCPERQTHQTYQVPASVGGINALEGLASMPPQDCIYVHNLMPSEYGLRLRKGYREWANGMNGKSINSLVPYEGQSRDKSKDRLWAVTEEGMFNVTSFGETTPTKVIDFGVGPYPEGSGWGVWTEFTNDADERFMHYADEGNGLYEYEEATDIWTKLTTAEISSVDMTFDPADVAYVMTWKNRLWYVMVDSGDAWYLPPDSKSGTVEKFTFGSKFQHGGDVRALYNWTVDGGDGVDDFLAVLSRGGDVLIYQGTDPATVDTFQLRGAWYIGEFPESRRVGVDYGGELYLLSTFGVISLRDLLQGVSPIDPGKTPSAKINRFLRDAVAEGKDEREWALTLYPADGFMQVVTPYRANNTKGALQYNQNLMTQAWGAWRGVPANCASGWSGGYFTGGKGGSVWEYTGATDGLLLDASNEPVAIEFDILTSFQAPGGDPTSFKRVGFIRPVLLQTTQVSLNVDAIYDYNLIANVQTPPTPSASDANTWDNTNWDEGVWDYAINSFSLPIGSLGIGRTVAVAMKGSSTNRITFAGWDISYTQGGFL